MGYEFRTMRLKMPRKGKRSVAVSYGPLKN
jgi:hypothetical protein